MELLMSCVTLIMEYDLDRMGIELGGREVLWVSSRYESKRRDRAKEMARPTLEAIVNCVLLIQLY